MNRQTAIGLIVASIIATITLYSNYKYYDNGKEISREHYLYLKVRMRETNKDWNIYSRSTPGNYPLVLLVFFGGLGLGHVFSDKLEDKTRELYRKFKDKSKT